MKIAIIDSGIGGLTVATAIKKLLPEESYIYCSDTANFPYGDKTEEQVVGFTVGTAERVIKKFHPDLLVVACNTASTVALELLRAKFSIPIVGVVPAIKPAAETSKTKVIGLLATKGTVTRSYTQDLIGKFASHCQVVRLGSSKLVQMAEAKIAGKEISLEELKKEVGEFLATPGMDTVILGCTHFPVLKEELVKISPKQMQWIDPGDAIARRVLEVSKGIAKKKENVESVFCYTKDTPDTVRIASNVKNHFGFSIYPLPLTE